MLVCLRLPPAHRQATDHSTWVPRPASVFSLWHFSTAMRRVNATVALNPMQSEPDSRYQRANNNPANNRGHRENAEPTGGSIDLDARWRGKPDRKSAKRKGVVG